MSSTPLFATPALRDLDALFDMIAEDSPARAARFIMHAPNLGLVCALFLYGPSWRFTASMATSWLWLASSTVGEISGRSTSSSDLAVGLYRFDNLAQRDVTVDAVSPVGICCGGRVARNHFLHSLDLGPSTSPAVAARAIVAWAAQFIWETAAQGSCSHDVTASTSASCMM
jgi:hypothetical protein